MCSAIPQDMRDGVDMTTPPVELRGKPLPGASAQIGSGEAASAPSISTTSTAVPQRDARIAQRGPSPSRVDPASSSGSRGASPSQPAYSGQTAISDVGSSIIPITPVGSAADKRPPSPDEYFTAAGRPARSASLKKVRYATDCDRDGNPIKTKEEKAAEKEKQRLKKEKEKAKKAEEKAARRSASATGSKSSVEPQSASGEASSSRSASVSTLVPASGAPRAAEMTRSGRQVTAPIDRHRSAAREAKASARKRQLQALQVREDREDEDDETGSEGNEGEDISSVEMAAFKTKDSTAGRPSVTAIPGQEGPSVQVAPATQSHAPSSSSATALRLAAINDDRDEMDLLEMSDEEDAVPTKTASRKKSSEVSQAMPRTEASKDETALAVTSNPTMPAAGNATSKAARASDVSSKREQAAEVHTLAKPVPPQPSKEPALSSDAVSSHQSRPSPMTPSTAPARPDVSSSRPETPEESARRSFSGKALSSLLSSTSHRRPGLGRRSFIPPLHPNRQPAPPPKTAPPMSKKDKDALKKEMLAREENGSDEDEDDEDKPKYNPFEEEIEGY